MSADLIWQLVGKNNCFRRTSNGTTFSCEPGNLTNLPTFRHSGFARKGLSISKKNAVTLTITNLKTKKATRTVSTMKLRKNAGFKHNAKAIHNVLVKNKFRPDLCKAAMKRLAILTKAQRLARKNAPKAAKKVETPAAESK